VAKFQRLWFTKYENIRKIETGFGKSKTIKIKYIIPSGFQDAMISSSLFLRIAKDL
jgi:hypothetical protein